MKALLHLPALLSVAMLAATGGPGTGLAQVKRAIRPEADPLAVLPEETKPPAAQPDSGLKPEADPFSNQGDMPKPKAREKAPPAPDRPPGDGEFMRYLDGVERQQLQTGVVRYLKDGRIVDLVGAVHLADSEYFDTLNAQLAQYEAVLYEMVGGPFPTREERAAEPEVAQIQAVHGLINKVLGMEYQTEAIDYNRPNFIHADIDWSQYRDLMEKRNQSLATLFERAIRAAESGDGPAILTDQEAANAMFSRLIAGLTSGNTADLKRAMAPFLGEAESFIAHIEGDDGTVLVTERNKVLLEILQRELAQGRRNVAVFYGAGHLPDLEKRLVAEGYRRDAGAWMTAWDITDPKPGEAVPNLWQNLLGDPAVLQGLIEGVQGMLKDLDQGGGVP